MRQKGSQAWQNIFWLPSVRGRSTLDALPVGDLRLANLSAGVILAEVLPMKVQLRIAVRIVAAMLCCQVAAASGLAQEYGPVDRDAPGDAMIQAYLKREAAAMDTRFADDLVPPDAWAAKQKQYLDEYYYTLGLAPLPEKTPLRAVVTSTQQHDGYVVENLHYQSRPGLYVTGNLYRPAKAKAGEKLPAVFYVCGHSGRGRNGNKVAYQSHGIWFARHGYVCLVVDSLQLGEIAATHHGTYRLDRWWWHARGYTPAGVEAWNGVRGIDYLIGRGDVDAKRIAVTGISGGGAATFWIAAADERVACAVPVSGMADLDSYVGNRVINGHCDCMFLYNTFRWPWPRIAGLIAPRPMLFVNSDADPIFPMDANERISNRLERLYGHHEASDRFGTMVSVGGHAYRRDIRKAAYQFINAQLKGDAREVTDSEIDIVSEGATPGVYPIPPQELRRVSYGRRSASRRTQHEDRRAFRADRACEAARAKEVRGMEEAARGGAKACVVRILAGYDCAGEEA